MAKEHTAIRADVGDLARADALIPRMSSPGLILKRSDVIRMAFAQGLTVLESVDWSRDRLDTRPTTKRGASK